jgi:3-isopropylmalate dehydrogenase
MFEPMGGSTPKYTGTGKINPIAAINAVSMLLEQLGQSAAAERITSALMHVTGTQMKSQNAGKMGFTTSEVGDLVLDALA